MTPDTALDPIEQPDDPVLSTSGMTTRVVKGSMWTLAGSVLPLAVAFVATPFVIRFLGAEGYGVLLLIGLIPTYFSFADFGMSVASTKFGSEAYGAGDRDKEGAVARTAALIALTSASIVAIPIFALSPQIVRLLNVPEYLLGQATTGLRIAAIAFVITVVAAAINSPMLARLRMDLNVATSAFPKMLVAASTPLVLYLGGSIVDVLTWMFLIGVAALAVSIYISGGLLPQLLNGGIRSDLFRPLLKFGGSWFVAMVAAMLLVNMEKLFLTKMVSVTALAYYSVAFTFANMATMFAIAMAQSLVPAFSQLLGPGRRAEFDGLFARSIRLNLIWLLPALMGMFVLARPFLTIWAGEDFGANSTLPLYVLLVGLFFNLQANVPYIVITSVGRTDVFARLYWIELAVYAVGAFLLISNFGIAGAAIAWTLRVLFDALIMIRLSKKYAGVRFKHLSNLKRIAVAALTLVPPVLLAAVDNHSPVLIGLVPISLAFYAVLVWRMYVDPDEKRWFEEKFRKLRASGQS